MRKPALLIGVTAAIAAASVAVAQTPVPTPSPLTIKGTSSVTKGAKGTKKKPTVVGMQFTVDTGTSDGTRPQGWEEINLIVPGVTSNGGLFPKCDAVQVASKQDIGVCPKGSQIATGKLKAKIGGAADFGPAGADCAKDISIYNTGQNKVFAYLSGPPAACAGITFQPPFPGTLKTSGGKMTLRIPIPDYITRPIPGALGSSISQTNIFKKQTTKVKGVKRGFFESTCKKGTSRTVTAFVIGDPDQQKYQTTSPAGKC